MPDYRACPLSTASIFLLNQHPSALTLEFMLVETSFF